MRTHQRAFDVHTPGRGFTDISSEVRVSVTKSGVVTGLAHVFVHHTSASLLIAENADNALRMRAILEGFARCDQQIVLPLHPRTRARLTSLDLRLPANVHAIDPVGFLDMVMLEKQASVIATDSGGVQKEAFFHRVGFKDIGTSRFGETIGEITL